LRPMDINTGSEWVGYIKESTAAPPRITRNLKDQHTVCLLIINHKSRHDISDIKWIVDPEHCICVWIWRVCSLQYPCLWTIHDVLCRYSYTWSMRCQQIGALTGFNSLWHHKGLIGCSSVFSWSPFSQDHVILCSIQFGSRLYSVESVPL